MDNRPLHSFFLLIAGLICGILAVFTAQSGGMANRLHGTVDLVFALLMLIWGSYPNFTSTKFRAVRMALAVFVLILAGLGYLYR